MPRKTKFNQLARKRLIIESLVAFLIILAPFIFKVYEYYPEEKGVNGKFLWFEITDHGFPDVSTYIWFVTGKLIPFYLLLIWFFTNKNWWYHILLIPILMYAFQLFELYFSSPDENALVDTENLLWLLPICIVVIPFVYFIRVKLYDKHVHGIDLKAMDTELKILKEKEELRKEREKLEQLKDKTSAESDLK